MNKIEERRFEVKSVDFNEQGKELTIKGYASVFGTPDAKQETYNPNIGRWVMASDIMEKGAFAKTISERKDKVKVCLNHDTYNLVGKIKELKEDDYGLYCEIKISSAEEGLQTKIREGIYTDFSFMFKTIKAEFEEKEDGNYIRHVKEVKLYEISVVTFPRHEGAVITELKAKENADMLIDSLLADETKENKRHKLLQLKSLVGFKPGEPLEHKEPNNADSLDFNKLNFLNN